MQNVVFGIDAMQIAPLTIAGDGVITVGTAVAVQGRSLSFNNESDNETFDANNKQISTRDYNKRTTGSIETAQHTPAVLTLLGNGEVTTTGTAPNQVITYTESADIIEKYVRIYSRSWAGDGSLVECIVLKAKPSGGSFDLSTGAYAAVSADFEGLPDDDNNLWSVASYMGTSAELEFA